jgi:hypothetical protein
MLARQPNLRSPHLAPGTIHTLVDSPGVKYLIDYKKRQNQLPKRSAIKKQA